MTTSSPSHTATHAIPWGIPDSDATGTIRKWSKVKSWTIGLNCYVMSTFLNLLISPPDECEWTVSLLGCLYPEERTHDTVSAAQII
jgi:hypothetical protein